MKSLKATAVLIDGGYFLKRYHSLISKCHTPKQVANNLFTLAKKHVTADRDLYRILYYDCMPLGKRVQNLVTKKGVDFSRTEEFRFRLELFEELKRKRKLALRLGTLKDDGTWSLKSDMLKKLILGKIAVSDIQHDDIRYNIRQKGIDMKIGIDIACLTLKNIVDQIILISGDADFVPAAKLARREGVDFVLDPMWNNIDDSLFEHIDGLRTTCRYMRKVWS